MQSYIPQNERIYLRELARKQAEYAALPIMAQRKQMWYDLNDGRPGSRPPIIIETWTFDRDFLPSRVFRCASESGRRIEAQLLRNIRQHELIDDDHVMPDTFRIDWVLDIDEFGGLKIPRQVVQDSQGIETGFQEFHPIQDLARDFALLKPAVLRVDRPATESYQAFVQELLGDVLPVELAGRIPSHLSYLTYRVISLMGMEAYFLAMYDMADKLHQLMAYLRDNALATMRWAEAERLLRPNNRNHESFGSSYNFTTKLPAPDYTGGPLRLCDMWGATNSQETVGISPELYHEFVFPYYRDICQPLGLLYYGCCEPVHPFWEDVRRLPHLKKVSISRWCDERFMGQALQGTGIVYSRKPDPRFLGIDQVLDENGWASHIRQSLEAAKGNAVEILVRDVYTVHGNLDKPRRAVEIARREIDRYY